MPGDPVIGVRRLSPGVYLIGFPGPGDGLLIDRANADPDWVTVADVLIKSGPDDDPTQLVRLAALAYYLRLRAVAVSPAAAPPPETA